QTAQATSTVQTISGGKTGYRAATATPVPGTALPVPKTSPRHTPKDWYASIPDAVIAESILNRLVVGAEIITLEGPNMRLEANE
ncbi:hypothetical protein ACOJAT_14635, partial [Corynebacterium striatum]